MIFKHLPVALSGLLISASLIAAQDAARQLVQAKTAALDPVADPHRGAAKWSHGAFLVQSVSGAALPPTFYTLDREGRLLSSVTASIPDAGYVSVFDCDRRDDSSIVFIGEAYSAYGQPAPLIGLISADGKAERVIRTAPYYPSAFSIAPDGTFWTLGVEMVNLRTSDPGLDPEAGVLRHFDRAGKFLGSALPQSHFVHSDAAMDRLGSGLIAATSGRIGWYGPSSGESAQYVEIDLNSMAPHSYPGLPDLPRGSFVVCFRLTESGDAFLSLYDNPSKRMTTLLFDRATLKWLPIAIKGPTASDRFGWYLIGVDGEQPVFRSGNSNAIFLSLSH